MRMPRGFCGDGGGVDSDMMAFRHEETRETRSGFVRVSGHNDPIPVGSPVMKNRTAPTVPDEYRPIDNRSCAK